MFFFRINNYSQAVQSTDNRSDIKDISSSTFISPFYTFSLAENKIVYNETTLFLSPFLVNTGWLLSLEKVFRNGYIAACNTAHRSATEENESGGHVDVPCSSKLTKHKSTADWLKFL